MRRRLPPNHYMKAWKLWKQYGETQVELARRLSRSTRKRWSQAKVSKALKRVQAFLIAVNAIKA